MSMEALMLAPTEGSMEWPIVSDATESMWCPVKTPSRCSNSCTSEASVGGGRRNKGVGRRERGGGEGSRSGARVWVAKAEKRASICARS